MGGFKEVSTDNSLPMITMAQTRKQRKGTDVEDFKEGILDISLPTIIYGNYPVITKFSPW